MGNSQQNTSGLQDHKHTDFEGNQTPINADAQSQRVGSSQSHINNRSMVENPTLSLNKDPNTGPAVKQRSSVPREFRINMENLRIATGSNQKNESHNNSIEKEESNSSYEDHRFSNSVESVAEEKLIETPNKQQHMSPTKVRQRFSKHRIRLNTSRSSSVRRNSVPGTFDTQKEYVETENNTNKENIVIVPKFENKYFYPPQALQQSGCSLGPLPKNAIRVSGISNMYKNPTSQMGASGRKNNLNDAKPITLVFKKHMLNNSASKVLNHEESPIAIIEEGQKIDKTFYDNKQKLRTLMIKPKHVELNSSKLGNVEGDFDDRGSQGERSNTDDLMKEPPKNVAYYVNNGQNPEFPNLHRNMEESVPPELQTSFGSKTSEFNQKNTNLHMTIKQNNLKALDKKAAGDMQELYDINLHYCPDETFKDNYFEAYIEVNSAGHQTNHLQTENEQNNRKLKLDLKNLNSSDLNPETELTPRENDSINVPELTAFFLNQSRPVSVKSQLNVSQIDPNGDERSQLTERSDPLSSSRINSMVSTARNSTNRGPNQQEQSQQKDSANTNVPADKGQLLKNSLNNVQLTFHEVKEEKDDLWPISSKDESSRNKISIESEKFTLERPGDLSGNSGVHVFLKLETRNKTSSRENTESSQGIVLNRKPTPTFSLNDSQDQLDEDFGIKLQPRNNQSSSNPSNCFNPISAQIDVWDREENQKIINKNQTDNEIERPRHHKDTEENKTSSKSMVETGSFAKNAKEFYSLFGTDNRLVVSTRSNGGFDNLKSLKGENETNTIENNNIKQNSSGLVKEARFRPRENYTKSLPDSDQSNQNIQKHALENSETSNSSDNLINRTEALPGPQSNISEGSLYSVKGQNRSTPARFYLRLDDKQVFDSLQLGDPVDSGKISNKSSEASHDLGPLSESGILPDNRDPSSELGQQRASFYLELTSVKSSPKALEQHFRVADENKELSSEPPQSLNKSTSLAHQISNKNIQPEVSEQGEGQFSATYTNNKPALKIRGEDNHSVLSSKPNNLGVLPLNDAGIPDRGRVENKLIGGLEESRQRHASVQTELETMREDSSRSQPRRLFETYQEWSAYKNKLKIESKQDSTVPNSQRTGEYVSAKEASLNNDSVGVLFSERYFQDRETIIPNMPNSVEDATRKSLLEPVLKADDQTPFNRNLADRSTHVRPSPKAEALARISIQLPVQNQNPSTREKEIVLDQLPQKSHYESQTERYVARENVSSLLQPVQNGRTEWRSKSLIEEKLVGSSDLFSSNCQPQPCQRQRNNLFSPESVGDCPFNSLYGSLGNIRHSAIGYERLSANNSCTFTQSRIEPSIIKNEEKHSHLEPSTIQFSFEEPVAMSLLSQLEGRHLHAVAPEPQISCSNPTPKPLIQSRSDQFKDNPIVFSSVMNNVSVSQDNPLTKQKAQPFKNQPISDYERILQKAMKNNKTKSKVESTQSNTAFQKLKTQRSQPKLQEPSKGIEQMQHMVQNETQNPQRALPIDDYVLSNELDRNKLQKFERKTHDGNKKATLSYADNNYKFETILNEGEDLNSVSDRKGFPGFQDRLLKSLEITNSEQVHKPKNLSNSNIQHQREDFEQNPPSSFQNSAVGPIYHKDPSHLRNNERVLHYLDNDFDHALNGHSKYSQWRAFDEQEKLIKRDTNFKYEAFDVSSGGNKTHRPELPFEIETRRPFQINDSSKTNMNLPKDYLQMTPGKRVIQLKGQMIINDDQDQAYASLILDNSYQLPVTERKRSNLDSAGRIRKNYLKEDWERIPRSTSAEQCNYGSVARAVKTSQHHPFTGWRKHNDDNDHDSHWQEDASKSFRSEINKLKQLAKRALDNEFEEQTVFKPAILRNQLYYYNEKSKENSMRLSNQNKELDFKMAQSSGEPYTKEESNNAKSILKGYNHEVANHFLTEAKKSANKRLPAAQRTQENVFLSSFEGNRGVAHRLRQKLFEPEYSEALHNSEIKPQMTPFDAIDAETEGKNRRILREIRRKREGSNEKRSNFITEALSKRFDNSSKAKNPNLMRSSSCSKHRSSTKNVKTNNVFAYPQFGF